MTTPIGCVVGVEASMRICNTDWLRSAFALVSLASCATNASTTTSASTQPIEARSDDGANGRVASIDVRLASGGALVLTATMLQPDPVYVIYGSLPGESSQDRERI